MRLKVVILKLWKFCWPTQALMLISGTRLRTRYSYFIMFLVVMCVSTILVFSCGYVANNLTSTAFIVVLIFIVLNTRLYMQYGETVLASTAIKGHAQIVKLLLSFPGIDVNLQNEVAFY